MLTLPSELLVLIFQSLDTFADLSALTRTAPIFHNVWKRHTSAIALSILPRVVTCTAEADGLFDAQHEAGVAQRRRANDHASVVHNTRHFLSNARSVSRVCDRFEADMLPRLKVRWPDHAPRMTARERTRFARACYLVWTYLTVASVPDARGRLRAFLAGLPMAELIRIRHLALWMYACTPESRVSLGLPIAAAPGGTEVWVDYTNIWAKGLERMAAHWEERVAGKVECRSFWVWDYAPPALLVAFDQDTLG